MGCVRILLTFLAVLVGLTLLLAVVLGTLVERDSAIRTPTPAVSSGGALPSATRTAIDPDTPLQQARVEWVSDGDTIRVQISGASESVRLIGIDAPEISHSGAAADCYSDEASSFLTTLVEGQTVWLESDVNDRDRYGRLLRYVWLRQGDGYLMVNQLLVSNGLAAARQYEEDDKHAPLLADTELEAIERGQGLWSACVTAEHQDTPGAPNFWDGESDLDCPDFSTRVNAQAFFAATGGPAFDPFNLDSDRNGLVCQTRPPTEPR
jgi:micrococcal nuclease